MSKSKAYELEPLAKDAPHAQPEDSATLTLTGPTSDLPSTVAFDDPRLQGRMTKWLFFAMVASAFGGMWPMGYNIGVINQPQEIVQGWVKERHNASYGELLSKEKIDVLWGWVVGVFTIGALFGAMVSGVVADRFGRKGGLLINNITSFIAAALLGLSKFAGSYELLFVGRIVVGFCAGLNSAIAPLYLTEISPVNLRGLLGSMAQLVVTISIWVSMIIGLKEALGNDTYWPLLFALTAAPSVLMLVTLIFCPESPRHLLINRNLKDRAEHALEKLRDSEDVSFEMSVMEMESKAAKAKPKVSFLDMFRSCALFWPLCIAMSMHLFQQLSGINVAMYYSTTIFKSAGLSDNEARYATIGMGGVNVAMTVVSALIVDRFGRRTLMIAGLIGMWLTTVGLVVCLSFTLNAAGDEATTVASVASEVLATTLPPETNIAAAYSSIVLLLLFVVSFATGPGSIPWFLTAELFEQDYRAHANSCAVVTNWGANLIVSIIFLPLLNAVSQYSFLFFTAWLTVGIIFCVLFMPETKGRSIESITQDFKDGKYRQI